MNRPLACAAGLAGSALLCLLALAPASVAAEAASAPSKVIVLGFDGADARLVEQYMQEGYLPNLNRLRRQGSYSPLVPTNPPQTPVSWSTFATGLDPGQHEIFDFLKRDPDTYAPDFAMMTPTTAPFLFGPRNPLYLGLGVALALLLLVGLLAGIISRRPLVGLIAGLVVAAPGFVFARSFVAENIPEKRPVAVNNRKGTPFWQTLAAAGFRSTVIRVPQTFPPDRNPGGRLLAGLGVPDIRGTFGTYTFYTSEPFTFKQDTEKGGKVVLLDAQEGTPEVETIVYGPFNKLFDDPPEITLPMTVRMDWGARAVTIKVSGQEFRLREGEWSEFIRFEFPVRKLVKVRGIARFNLLQLGPHLKLYLQAINFDPQEPVLPITDPAGWSKEIYKLVGNWKTLGWAMDTWALDEGVTTEKEYAEDRDYFVTRFERMMDHFIGDPADRLFVQVFYYTDRDGHMFWRFLDEQNPAFDPDKASDWRSFIRESYQRMDRAVGKAMEKLPPDGVLFVVSDHGFSSWRHSFNINTWLVRNGFMVLKGQDDGMKTLDDLFVSGSFFQNVDWSRTRAYALGLGCVYINLLGRERDGIVSPGAEYDQVCREIQERLEAFVDPATGEHPVHKVYRRDEMYSDFDPDLIPDLRAANGLNYRVSWQTSLGGAPPDYFEKHASPWSGDHCSLDPQLVRGILFCSRPLSADPTPQMHDFVPTLFSLYGLPAPAEMPGRSLFGGGGDRAAR